MSLAGWRMIRLRKELLEKDAAGQRPACDLITQTEVDTDGRIWLSFFCVTHEASWRELLGAAGGRDLEIAQSAVTSGTPCGVRADADEEIPVHGGEADE